MAISGDTALIGARGDDDNGFSAGAAYAFDLSHQVPVPLTMDIEADEYGRYGVFLTVYPPLSDWENGYFYATGMDASTLSLRGLCTSGQGFSGDLVVGDGDAQVSGTYYNMVDDGWAGGTFSGELIND